MGKNKDVQPRTRKAAGPAEQAARSSMIARKAAGERKKAVEAAAAARAAMQASLLGSGRQRASGAGSSSQDAGGVPAASQSAEAAAAGDRAVPAAAEPQAAAADDVLEQGEAMLYHDKQRPERRCSRGVRVCENLPYIGSILREFEIIPYYGHTHA